MGDGVRIEHGFQLVTAAALEKDSSLEIGEALARCDWFLVVLSPQATRSKWVKRELLYALRSSRYEGRIVPIRLRACDPALLSWTLEDFQAVDFTQDFDNGCRSLLRIWGLGYKQA